ncbi:MULTISPECIES: virulence protein RhuM/Fic/DOC family protein [Cysteiniphilum]|uniref:Cytochrome c n=1 Tax=Cysteiniphilum litorale TaxID=2056700 RepID=A0A8J2Z6P3_9GAMM|nr:MULTISPECIES: virulence protein RhuM/Fic/DOC family protein [Cysteiniphilum]GGG06327.1 cytochrome c [Cysteiniphilum litorale]
MSQEIIAFNTGTGDIEVNFDVDNETVWLSQGQMVQLFDRDQSVISRHIRNIFKDGEIDEKSNMQKMHISGSDKPVTFFSLDIILSVGYRVNSKKGVQFRQWANKILKDHLIKGYTLNEKRLQEQSHQIQQLEKTLSLIQSVEYDKLSQNESSGLLTVLTEYTHSFILLNQYDSDRLKIDNLSDNIIDEIDYVAATKAIERLKKRLIDKKEATELFGNQKDNSFEGLLGNVMQSFGSEYLYPSIEEQAAHLLYFIIKNHPFTDGNKRIGAFMFIWFLERNKHHLKHNGDQKISDNALVAIALLVAQSDPSQKEVIIKLVINLIKN